MFTILNGKSATITSAALVLAGTAAASRFLGFVRNALLAAYFGAGDTIDAYYAAFMIPDLLFNILVVGALSAGFIPVFTKYLHKSPKEAWRLANDLMTILTIALTAIAIMLVFLAPYIIPLIAPGFGGDKLDLTIFFSRIMFLQPIFLGLSSVFGGILQSFKKFLSYSLAPIFYNIGIIVGIVVFVPVFGLTALAWGVVLGAFLHLMVQVPAGIASGFRYKFVFDFGFIGLKKIAVLMMPRTLSLIIMQINLFITTMIASTLKEGSLTMFNFANDLQYLPIGVFATSLAVAAFPELSSLSAQDNRRKLIEVFSGTARKILFFLIPLSFLMIVLRAQIVRVALGYGHFDWKDTVLTIETLAFFSLGIAVHGLAPLLVRAFFALHNTVIPLAAGVITVIVNIILALFLSRFLGVGGLALAFSIASFVEAGILFFFLKSKLGGIGGKTILSGAIKFTAASLFAAAASWIVLRLVDILLDTHTVSGIFIQGLAAGIGGIGVYIWFAFWLRCKETRMLKQFVFGKSKSITIKA